MAKDSRGANVPEVRIMDRTPNFANSSIAKPGLKHHQLSMRPRFAPVNHMEKSFKILQSSAFVKETYASWFICSMVILIATILANAYTRLDQHRETMVRIKKQAENSSPYW